MFFFFEILASMIKFMITESIWTEQEDRISLKYYKEEPKIKISISAQSKPILQISKNFG